MYFFITKKFNFIVKFRIIYIMRRITILLFCLIFPVILYSQSVKDSSLQVHFASLHFGYQIPGGDIAKRYGNSGYAGISYFFKTSSNWIIEAQYDYIFGENHKEPEIFSNITTKEGLFFTKDGGFLEIVQRESGFFGGIKIGRIIPVFSKNPNSGILIQLGGGLLQYKTTLDGNDNIPAVDKDHIKGYDRLCNGLALNQFIGYMHFDARSRINFYAGFEFFQAWTSNRRDFDYYTMSKMVGNRHDYLYSFKFGWLVPFSQRSPDKYYFN